MTANTSSATTRCIQSLRPILFCSGKLYMRHSSILEPYSLISPNSNFKFGLPQIIWDIVGIVIIANARPRRKETSNASHLLKPFWRCLKKPFNRHAPSYHGSCMKYITPDSLLLKSGVEVANITNSRMPRASAFRSERNQPILQLPLSGWDVVRRALTLHRFSPSISGRLDRGSPSACVIAANHV